MKRILLVDVETTGLDAETDRVVELGCILWDIAHRTRIASFAALLSAPANPAEAINRIPESLLRELEIDLGGDAWATAARFAEQADAFVAHNATFDRGFVRERLGGQPWICSCDDIAWPMPITGHGLVSIALSHGVPVLSAHRALADCALIAGLLERCAELGHDVGAMLSVALTHARLPKFRYVSLEPFERREEVKAAGFRWDPARREWWRVMATAEAAALPFLVRQGAAM